MVALAEADGAGPATRLEPSEAARLAQCEEVIGRGLETFLEVDLALIEIRDERLYRSEFPRLRIATTESARTAEPE